MSEFYVYILFRPNGIPCYVGKGKDHRIKYHERVGSNHYNKHLARIIAKAGGSLPNLTLREGLSERDAFAMEIAFIAAIGRINSGGPLVNLTDGGEGISGLSHTEKSKEKMRKPKSEAAKLAFSKAQKMVWGRKPEAQKLAMIEASRRVMVGSTRSDGAKIKQSKTLRESQANGLRRERISLALKGKIKTKAHCEAISRAKSGISHGPHSEETKAMIGAKRKAAWDRIKFSGNNP